MRAPGAARPAGPQLPLVMPWTVRTPDGALTFDDPNQLAWAFQHGLVGPEDEIKDGDGPWRRAREHPLFRQPPRAVASSRPRVRGAGWAVLLGLVALVLWALGYWTFALAVGLALALYLLRMNLRTLRPRTFARS